MDKKTIKLIEREVGNIEAILDTDYCVIGNDAECSICGKLLVIGQEISFVNSGFAVVNKELFPDDGLLIDNKDNHSTMDFFHKECLREKRVN